MTQIEENALLDKVKEQASEVLEQFKGNTITKAQFDEMFKGLETGMTKAQKESFDELTETVKLQAQVIDQLKNMQAGEKVKGTSFGEKFNEGVAANFDKIKFASKSNPVTFELKVVGDMYLPNNLTGTAQKTYRAEVVSQPDRRVHLRDLIPIVNSETGLYTFYRETGSEGQIARQTDPNATKAQLDYDFTEVVVTATYLAGFVVIHKSMLQDLPFLQTGLPQMLVRDFYKAEDADFYAVLAAVAIAGVSGSTVPVEQIIDYIAQLMAADFDPTAILVSPAAWASILKTTVVGGGYSVPFGTTIDTSGTVRMLGVPLYVSTLIPDGKVLVGDFTQAQIVVVDGLKVEFFEQDVDNVRKNKVTVRVEAREALAVLNPNAFILGDLGDVIPLGSRRSGTRTTEEKPSTEEKK